MRTHETCREHGPDTHEHKWGEVTWSTTYRKCDCGRVELLIGEWVESMGSVTWQRHQDAEIERARVTK